MATQLVGSEVQLETQVHLPTPSARLCSLHYLNESFLSFELNFSNSFYCVHLN